LKWHFLDPFQLIAETKGANLTWKHSHFENLPLDKLELDVLLKAVELYAQDGDVTRAAFENELVRLVFLKSFEDSDTIKKPMKKLVEEVKKGNKRIGVPIKKLLFRLEHEEHSDELVLDLVEESGKVREPHTSVKKVRTQIRVCFCNLFFRSTSHQCPRTFLPLFSTTQNPFS